MEIHGIPDAQHSKKIYSTQITPRFDRIRRCNDWLSFKADKLIKLQVQFCKGRRAWMDFNLLKHDSTFVHSNIGSTSITITMEIHLPSKSVSCDLPNFGCADYWPMIPQYYITWCNYPALLHILCGVPAVVCIFVDYFDLDGLGLVTAIISHLVLFVDLISPFISTTTTPSSSTSTTAVDDRCDASQRFTQRLYAYVVKHDFYVLTLILAAHAVGIEVVTKSRYAKGEKALTSTWCYSLTNSAFGFGMRTQGTKARPPNVCTGTGPAHLTVESVCIEGSKSRSRPACTPSAIVNADLMEFRQQWDNSGDKGGILLREVYQLSILLAQNVESETGCQWMAPQRLEREPYICTYLKSLCTARIFVGRDAVIDEDTGALLTIVYKLIILGQVCSIRRLLLLLLTSHTDLYEVIILPDKSGIRRTTTTVGHTRVTAMPQAVDAAENPHFFNASKSSVSHRLASPLDGGELVQRRSSSEAECKVNVHMDQLWVVTMVLRKIWFKFKYRLFDEI
ncbi:hypothetical protein IW261DRAFT_1424778 [Armillaria novae-zelandiae]|uniref:Uncharacterized protein n=1 Tax=Armillaria novae-zelandiae TaxID=153914 RepID=A0AA39NUI2_9AGAR|nr:hypothetical protein IW261DRAFT_1424778 [Armillaria novae-zelandiae]